MKQRVFKVCIIGLGNIGKKRFDAISKIKKYKINITHIIDKKQPDNLDKKIIFYNDWKKIISKKVDLIIIATPTFQSKIIAKKLSSRFNILVEKPLSEKLNELKKIIKNSNENKKLLKVGYNLRFDDGLTKVKKLLIEKKIGNPYYIKIAYANGAVKTNSNKIGSLLDIGTHSLNLLMWLMNNHKFKVVKSIYQKNEFLKKTKIDNGFILLKSKNIISSIHHGFCTWKNIFDLEIIGSKGLIRVKSLSKWNDQKVMLGTRRLPDGSPKIKQWTFRKDNSWKKELEFVFNKLHLKGNSYKKINSESYDTIKLIKNFSN